MSLTRSLPSDPKLVISIDDDEDAPLDQSKAVEDHITSIIGAKRITPDGIETTLSPDKNGSPRKREVKGLDKLN